MAKGLTSELKEIHEKAVGDRDSCYQDFNETEVVQSNRSYCTHCGYVGSRSNLKRHHQRADQPGHGVPSSSVCLPEHLSSGTVLKNKFGFQVPKTFLDMIFEGRSPLLDLYSAGPSTVRNDVGRVIG